MPSAQQRPYPFLPWNTSLVLILGQLIDIILQTQYCITHLGRFSVEPISLLILKLQEAMIGITPLALKTVEVENNQRNYSIQYEKLFKK